MTSASLQRDYSVAIDNVVAGLTAGTTEVTPVESTIWSALCSGTHCYRCYRAKVEKPGPGTGAWLVVSGTTITTRSVVLPARLSDDGYRVTLTYKVGSKTVATADPAGYS